MDFLIPMRSKYSPSSLSDYLVRVREEGEEQGRENDVGLTQQFWYKEQKVPHQTPKQVKMRSSLMTIQPAGMFYITGLFKCIIVSPNYIYTF